MNSFIPWFQKVINFIVNLFFIFAAVSTLFAFASPFGGFSKYLIVFILAIIVFVFFYIFKEKIRLLIKFFLNKIKSFPFYKLLGIIIFCSIFLKVIYSIFFYFDSTQLGGDISIYANLADEIVTNGLSAVEGQIYYLVGMAFHLSILKRLSIPYHIGIYILFLIGTIINYYSFSKLIGKEEAFIVIIVYLLMPSTCLLTFCITHELLGYFYFSIILYLFTLFFNTNEIKKEIIFGFFLTIFICLNTCISPMAKIWFIVLGILIILTKISWKKRVILAMILVISIFSSNYLTTRMEGNTQSQSNNVEQLLIGCDLNSMGRHTDGRGKNAARTYWESQGVELTYENLVEGETEALKQEYLNLLAHPVSLFELLANKFYTIWSGDFYSIEMAYAASSISGFMFYLMIIISTLLWLLMICIGIVYYKKKEENIGICIYKLVLLGIVAVLLIVEVTNKYSCYMTLFIYFISICRANLLKENTNE